MLIREKLEQLEKDTMSEFAALSINTRGRDFPLEKSPYRTEFQRDRDRILHSNAFRRLKDKTQVFLAPQGDHYRTRLTHTLEVSQIARSIAKALFLNEDLTEAIALGHDLGHTPFGHAGEEALADVHGEFLHEVQSVRVVEHIENDYKGLNLTVEVRDGILYHSDAGDLPMTLEGRIVRISDKIAYINHDIEDAVRAGVLDVRDIPKECTELLGYTKSQRIATMVGAIVDDSTGKNEITLDPDILDAHYKLKKFMFVNVYCNPIAKTEESKSKEIVRILYTYFIKNKDLLPDEYKAVIDRYGLERVVCDYISGMSDHYAINKYQDIYIPKVWAK